MTKNFVVCYFNHYAMHISSKLFSVFLLCSNGGTSLWMRIKSLYKISWERCFFFIPFLFRSRWPYSFLCFSFIVYLWADSKRSVFLKTQALCDCKKTRFSDGKSRASQLSRDTMGPTREVQNPSSDLLTR